MDTASRRWSLVDAGAAVAVLLAAAGVIWSPKLSGAVARATGGLEPVTVLVDVRGVPVADSAFPDRRCTPERQGLHRDPQPTPRVGLG